MEKKLIADKDAKYDEYEEIDLSKLEPLIACPSSPDKSCPGSREVAGMEIGQAMIGSSANPGFRDFAIAALIVDGKKISDHVSFDINPTSRQILENLTTHGYLEKLIRAGGRIHQAGCNGCIGMGQAPATHRISLLLSRVIFLAAQELKRMLFTFAVPKQQQHQLLQERLQIQGNLASSIPK